MKLPSRAQTGQGAHLLVHAVVGIAEPPGGAQLDLAGNLIALEGTDEGAQHVHIGGVQAVQDDAGAFVGLGQLGEQPAQRHAAIRHGDHVEAAVGAQLLEHLGVGVAQAAVVDLHDHAVLLVQAAHGQQHVGGVGVALLLGQRLTGHRLLEGRGGSCRRRCRRRARSPDPGQRRGSPSPRRTSAALPGR